MKNGEVELSLHFLNPITMQLSKNFSLAEMLESATARRMRLVEQFTPNDLIQQNLSDLCTHVLQPLRDFVGPIYVSSGYRCPALNQAVHGAKNSQHLYGQAADLKGLGKITNKMLFETIIDLKLPFDQLINEFSFAWVHVSYGPRRRGQILKVV